MPPKRGQKRKKPGEAPSKNDDEPLRPPKRETWPGWVEMESEPALFNVMLREMGVRGVKIQEVYGLDDELLDILPQPVHAFIFLFRYRDTDHAQQPEETECPKHIWFANQIPDFACASVALLNIVNNIKGLQIGTELQQFREFTLEMDPMSRGDAIETFEFVKKIHNSFARETDLLVADMHTKQKALRAKKKQALAKARDTRAAKKAGTLTLQSKSPNVNGTPTRTSNRTKKATEKTPQPAPPGSGESSPLSDVPESGSDFESSKKSKKPADNSTTPSRRSARKPKPRKDITTSSEAAEAEDDDDEGFHFVAYMPIQGEVWKLDGLDSFPQHVGDINADGGGDWINVAQPALATRMAMYEGADIEFNLMAVVRDPIIKDRAELAQNVKELQMLEKSLDSLSKDWRFKEGTEERIDCLTGPSIALEVSQANIDAADVTFEVVEASKGDPHANRLLELRKDRIRQQAPLKGAIRDALEAAKADDEKARHRRHDYGKFVKSWLGALAEQEILSDIIEGS